MKHRQKLKKMLKTMKVLKKRSNHLYIWIKSGDFLQRKSLDGCRLQFENLAKVAEVVLVLPQSNASEERVISLIRLNKTLSILSFP